MWIRLEPHILIGNVVSGMLWLILLTVLTTWVLAVIGAVYVAATSIFLSAVYARETVSVRQEALAWSTPWLLAVALWVWVGSLVEGGASGRAANLWFGLLLGTACYLAWQLSALVVRQLLGMISASESGTKGRAS